MFMWHGEIEHWSLFQIFSSWDLVGLFQGVHLYVRPCLLSNVF